MNVYILKHENPDASWKKGDPRVLGNWEAVKGYALALDEQIGSDCMSKLLFDLFENRRGLGLIINGNNLHIHYAAVEGENNG